MTPQRELEEECEEVKNKRVEEETEEMTLNQFVVREKKNRISKEILTLANILLCVCLSCCSV